MKLVRRLLLALLLLAAGAWLALSGAVAWALPPGWQLTNWPLSLPGLAAVSAEGLRARWSPLDWRGMRLSGQNFTPRGSRLGPITALDAELRLEGPFAARRESPWLDFGAVAVPGLSVIWGQLRFTGLGALEREAGGLAGQLHGRVEGLESAMGQIARAGAITVMRPGGEVTLPVSVLSDGRIMLGPVPVANWR